MAAFGRPGVRHMFARSSHVHITYRVVDVRPVAPLSLASYSQYDTLLLA